MPRCISLLLAAASCLFAQSTPPEIRFDYSDPLHPPEGFNLGEAAGIAVNSKGHIFVFERGIRARLHEFDQNGKYLREIGKDLYGFSFAHVVRIDKDDNIWCVDEGSNMVIEFTPQGKVIMLLGRKPEAVEAPPAREGIPPARPNTFNRPTDVTWDTDGNAYIADGYNNSRVAKVSKDGDWIKAWGKRGTDPGDFHTVHSIAIDNQNRLYVGDRENNRIQVFDTDGKFLKAFTNVGAPWAVCITPGPKQVLYTSDSRVGKFYKLDLDGNILGTFGKAGHKPGTFGWVHEISCPSENVLFVGELLNWRVQKLVLHP